MKRELFTKDFTLLVLGQAFSLAGGYVLRFALSMYVLELTGSAGVFAGMLAAAMLPTILLSPLGGVLADRCDRRRLMVLAGALAGAAALLALPALEAFGGTGTAAGLLILLSVLGAFESPVVQAALPQLHSGENILRGNAVINQVAALAGLAAPFLGSLLYAALGLGPVLLGAGPRFLVPALLGLTVLQLTALFAVPVAVYHAFGLTGSSAMSIICTQALVTLAVSNLPLPGAVGASEGGFVAAMALFFGPALVTPAVLLSRGISFYAFLLVSAVITLAVHLRARRKRGSALPPPGLTAKPGDKMAA